MRTKCVPVYDTDTELKAMEWNTLQLLMTLTCCRKPWKVAMGLVSLCTVTSSLYTLMSSQSLWARQNPTKPCPFRLLLSIIWLSSRWASSKTRWASDPAGSKYYQDVLLLKCFTKPTMTSLMISLHNSHLHLHQTCAITEPWQRSSSYQQSCRWRSWGTLCWGIFLSAATHQRKASSQWSPPDCSGRNTQTHGCPGTEDALKHKDKEHTWFVWCIQQMFHIVVLHKALYVLCSCLFQRLIVAIYGV